jgi:hypothetical protein
MARQYEPTQSIDTVEIDNNQLHSPACHRLKAGSHVGFVVVGKGRRNTWPISCLASMNEALVDRLHTIQHLVD